MSLKKVIYRGLISLVLFTAILPNVFGQDILPDSARACMVDSLMLDAGPGDTYLWSTGETTQVIWVDITGPYEVTVTLDTIIITDEVFVSIVDAEILNNDTTIMCADTIMLKGSSDFYDYTWATTYTLEEILGTDDSVYVYPRDTSYIYSKIADPAIEEIYCVDSTKVNVESIINVDSLWQYDTVCPNINNAIVQFESSGGYPPYMFDCTEGIVYNDATKPYVEILKLKDGEKVLTITDTIGCLLNHTFEVVAHPLPEINLYSNPSDTVYLQKPYVDFYYENVSRDSLPDFDPFIITSNRWYLETPLDTNAQSIDEYPNHTYSQTGTYDVIFHYHTNSGCDADDTIRIVVEPVKLAIPVVMTTNGDGANDNFEIVEDNETGDNGGEGLKSGDVPDPIDLSKYYISNKLTVFNRYGQKVFEVENYENDWDGGGLQDGVYFYILECHGEYEDKVYKGSVTIINGN